MENKMIIAKTVTFVQQTLTDAEGGHDWFHMERVWNNAKHIGAREGNVDMLIVELGALLHDIADAKFHDGDEEVGPRVAGEFLTSLGFETSSIDHVVNIVRHISYKGNIGGQKWMSPELAVVQDADRLDALGAIGIARAFNYGGFKSRPLYDPSIPPNMNLSKEEYKKADGTTVNHFYEKLLLLKDKMNTETGHKMAEGRHEFIERYLEQFKAEWSGEK